jgi:hypothetical protein
LSAYRHGGRIDACTTTWKPTAHGFLKLWERRDLIVAFNPGDKRVGGTITRSNAIALARRIKEECPLAVICLLAEGSTEPEEIKPEGPSVWWASAVFGFRRAIFQP